VSYYILQFVLLDSDWAEKEKYLRPTKY